MLCSGSWLRRASSNASQKGIGKSYKSSNTTIYYILSIYYFESNYGAFWCLPSDVGKHSALPSPNLRAVVCFNEKIRGWPAVVLEPSWAQGMLQGILVQSFLVAEPTGRLALSYYHNHYYYRTTHYHHFCHCSSLSLSIAICQTCQPQRWACIKCSVMVSSVCCIISCTSIIDELYNLIEMCMTVFIAN